MLSETVRKELQLRTSELVAAHPAVVEAKAGRVGPEGVANYLASLRFLISQTVPHLTRARDRATQLKQLDLASCFERKIAEETGHERWAEEDLRELSRHGGVAVAGRPLPAIVELARYLNELIERDPRMYLVYALCTEYFTVLAGPTWISVLTEHCGVPGAALTVASKHVAADEAHAEHGFLQIDALLASEPGLEVTVANTVRRTLSFFDQFFREVVSEPS